MAVPGNSWHVFSMKGDMHVLAAFSPVYIGITAGILTGISMLPQLVKILREKKADDISIPMLFILFAGLALWVTYGVMINDLPLIITNSFSLLVNLLIIVFSLRYR
jgi:MtN3 and saliva related transmembrane protein